MPNKIETHSNTFFEQEGYREIPQEYQPIIITDHFSTPTNLGSIIRLAANIGAKKVIAISDQDFRISKVKKTAGAAHGHIQVEYIEENALHNFLPDGYQLVALETCSGSKNIFQEQLPDKMALILGSEKYGIRPELLAKCAKAVHIPMCGPIKSMNVTHAASVCLFQWYYQISNRLNLWAK